MFDEEGWEEEDGWGEEDSDDGCDYGCGEFCSEPGTKDAGLCTTECQAYLCSVEADADGGTSGWKCDDCGCTDGTPCVGSLGQTCHWVRKNLCSSCAEKRRQSEHMDDLKK
jgi:hypothetical protein